MTLTSKKKAYLRKLAHDLVPIVRIGKDGYSDMVGQSILDAIDSRELIKVKILQNCESTKEEVIESIIAGTKAEVVGLVGRTIILFKANNDKPVISQDLKRI